MESKHPKDGNLELLKKEEMCRLRAVVVSIGYGWILANRDEVVAVSNQGLKRNGGLKVVNRDGSKP